MLGRTWRASCSSLSTTICLPASGPVQDPNKSYSDFWDAPGDFFYRGKAVAQVEGAKAILVHTCITSSKMLPLWV